MNTKNWHKTWREFSPTSLTWLEKVQITNHSTFDKQMTYLVPITRDKDNKENWSVAGTLLTPEMGNKIQLHAKKLGWKGKGTISLLVDETAFILISPSSLDVSAAQKGRQVGIDGAGVLKNLESEKIALCAQKDISALDFLDGLFQGLYSLTTFKGDVKSEQDKAPKPKETLPVQINLFCPQLPSSEIANCVAFAKSLMLAKWLEDAPPNWLTSERFGQIAQDLATERKLTCKIRGREEIEALGMGCFASVAGGSRLDPKFITLEVDGVDNSQAIVLVGKGLTFDSGGISIKPSQGMEEMKYDMCGGANVLATAYYLSHVKPKTKVICLIGAVENMPGELATRPSDIVTAYNKKTVEILNTDAEGRLVLCDLLAFGVSEYKPKLIVDIATLTGAVAIALGSFGSGFMTNQQAVADFTLNLSRKIGEPTWHLPLWPELAKEIQSDIADYKNIASSSVKAGSLVAGQYLKEFVGDYPWLHLDIAATGWNCKATGYPSGGGSGYGLRMLSEICLNFEG